MPHRPWRDRIEDILDAVARVEEYVEGLDRKGFTADSKSVDAVVRNLEVIGEAAAHVPDEVRDRYPEIPWREIRAMRNRLSHAYFAVDVDVVWKTARDDLDALVPALRRMLAETDESID